MSVFLTSPAYSKHEQSAFDALTKELIELNPRLATPPEASPETRAVATPTAAERNIFEQALTKAATIGWFNPEQLTASIAGPSKERVLSELVANSEVQVIEGRKLWRLRREPRREVLATLTQSPDLQGILKNTAALATDPDARLLRKALRGHSVDAARARTDEDRASMLRVAEWTQGIVEHGPKSMDVRAAMARDGVMDSLDQLISGFHGRTAELKQLRKFLTEGSRQSGPPFLGISGIGGTGKSALLARFADQLLTRPASQRPAVVLIDFDRARFSSGDPLALTFEVTRQVGAWFPALADDLQRLRHEVRRSVQSGSAASRQDQDYASLESATRGNKELYDRLRGVLGRLKIGTPGGRPLVLVLDTFEVLQGHDGADSSGFRGAAAVVNWARDLYLMGLPGLRVIVAGRAPIQEDPVFGRALTEPELLLQGLDADAARRMLVDNGLTAKDARLVVDAVGDPDNGTCNPLVLRLAARLVKGGKVKASALKTEKRARKSFDTALVQGILYQRILKHLGDREEDRAIAELAHPGLVLRRVTPDLIKRVLIRLTALRKRNLDSDALFQRLRREVWLVRDAGQDAVEHRTDLRRTMLKLIEADRKMDSKRIHRAAIRYYESGKDAHLTKDAADGEAYYHRLMLLDRRQAAKIKVHDVRRFESSLFRTLDDLPPHVLAIVKLSIEQPLTDKEGLSLPAKHRQEFILKQGNTYLVNDEPYRALALLQKAPQLHPTWELRALALTVQWILARNRGLLRVPATDHSERATLAAWIGFCLRDTDAALKALAGPTTAENVEGNWGKLDDAELVQMLRGFTYSTVVTRDTGVRESMVFGTGQWDQLREEQVSSSGAALEVTRNAVLAAKGDRPGGRIVINSELLPPSPKQLKKLAKSLPPQTASLVSSVVASLTRIGTRASSGQILGTISRSFTKTVIVESGYWKLLHTDWRLLCSNPEFRGPVKFAVMETFTTKSDFSFLAAAANGVIDMHPYDLRPSVFSKRAIVPSLSGQEIAALIHFVDRAGALGALLKRLRSRKPNAPKLRLVAEAFERWESAMDPLGK